MEFFNIVQFIFSDAVVFALVQLLVVGLVIYARISDGKKTDRRQYFYDRPSSFVLAYSVISASVIQAVTSADLFSGFKVVVTLADLSAVFYLCFYSRWFRGVVMQVLGSAEKVRSRPVRG